MRTEDLVREFTAAEWWLSSLRGDVREVRGTRFVRNDDLARVFDANLGWVDDPETDLRDLEASWDAVFSGSAVRHRKFVFGDAEAAFRRQEEFAAAGYVPEAAYVMLHAGEKACVTNDEVEVRPVPADDPDFAAIRLGVEAAEGYDPEVVDQLARKGDREAKAAGTACFVGYLRGEPAGMVGLHTFREIGVVDYVGTLPALRGRGVGVTLLCRTIEQSRLLGHRHLLLSVDLDNPAKRIYEDLQFRVIGEIRAFLLEAPATTPRSNIGI